MRKWITAILVVATVVGVSVYVSGVSAEGTIQPEKGIIVGTVVDVANYGMHGRIGEEFAAEGVFRAEHNFPVAIVEEDTGKVYIALYRLPVPAAGLQTANGKLAPFMGKKVAVQGFKYHAPGLNVIRISIVSEY